MKRSDRLGNIHHRGTETQRAFAVDVALTHYFFAQTDEFRQSTAPSMTLASPA